MVERDHLIHLSSIATGKDYRDCGRPCDKHKVEIFYTAPGPNNR